MSKAHPGFSSVQSSIAKRSGVSKESAGAILASATRKASAGAKKANPRLKKVLGKMHTGGTIPQDGIYEMEAGEHVTPNKKGSQFNHPSKQGEGISPDGIIKRDGKKRFDF